MALYQLVFYVPESHLEAVKSALYEAGAGRIGDYDQCCWQVRGTGQFRPLAGSKPFLGEESQLVSVMEYRVEMVFESHLLGAVGRALVGAHPYEEPAYGIWPLISWQQETE